MTMKLQQFLFEKNFKEVEKQINMADKAKLPIQSQLLIDITMVKIMVERTLEEKSRLSTIDGNINYRDRIKEIQAQYLRKVDDNILEVHIVGMQGFLVEIGYEYMALSSIKDDVHVSSQNSNSQISFNSHLQSQSTHNEKFQKQFQHKLSKLPNLSQIFPTYSFSNNTNQKHKVQTLCQQSPYFCIALLELYTKRSINLPKHKLTQQVHILTQLIEKYHRKFKLENVYNVLTKLYTIAMHLFVHCSSITNDHSQLIRSYLEKCSERLQGKNKLMSVEIVVVFLYNCLKMMLGFTFIPQKIIQSLDKFYKLFDLHNPGKNYSTHILQIFFIIKIQIFKTSQQQQNNIQRMLTVNHSPSSQQLSFSNQQEQQKISAQNFRISQLLQKFSCFLNINLDQTIVELNQITRAIIRYKVASLATIIGVKLGIRRFSKDFLEIMHDSSFSNDIQTIKLCFELFEFGQFQKLQHLLQIVLAVPVATGHSVQTANNTAANQRQVMIAMCGIFNGLYLENREEGLLYCKLNHKNYLALNNTNTNHKISHPKSLLKQETLLEHIGFGYYNMAKHQIYYENRISYMTKALENFQKSYEINPDNYLLNYCLGKIYLKQFDYQNAYKYTMESCKSHRGSWAPFCLLACIYMCQRKIHKSIILIDEILKKYENTAILHYIRAYLEVNKLLLEVQNDQEIQAAKILGEQFYFTHYDRILKSKSFHNVVKYCQNYYQLSMGNPLLETDENFFSAQNISLQVVEGQQYLLKIIKLFIEIGQLSSAQSVLKLMPSNHPPVMACKGLLHERRKELKQAKQCYQQILNIDPCYSDALIKLAFIQLQEQENNLDHNFAFYKEQENSDMVNNKNLNNAGLYLEIASKFVKNSEYILAYGLMLSKAGKIKQGNQLLLQNCEIGWCDQLPDLLYYY